MSIHSLSPYSICALDKKQKKKILSTAVRLFIEKGFLDTSTANIAKKAGVAHGTVFIHFSTRADLVIAAIYKGMEKLRNSLNEKSEDTNSLEELCNLFLDEVTKPNNIYKTLVKELPLFDIKTQRMVFASLSGFSWHFYKVLKKGKKKDLYRKVDPETVLKYWFGTVNYLLSYSKLFGTEKLGSKQKKQIIDFFINSVSILNWVL